MIKIKRIYEQPAKEDGFRILVDRLWPRGISKDKAKTDLWLREIGPSDDLRNWFSHDPEKWQGFKTKYEAELSARARATGSGSWMQQRIKPLHMEYPLDQDKLAACGFHKFQISYCHV